MKKDKKKKIALVNQRYGLEVNGGSEYYTRQLAEHLSDRYDVEILTTKALNYDTWENYYTEDVEEINGVRVRRFDVDKKRSVWGMRINGRIRRYFPGLREQAELRWVEAQGPCSTGLINYIESNKDNYDVFIFVTYLYYSTAVGLEKVADKAILVPTAHDEPYIYFDIYRHIFEKAAGLIYLTPEEKDFVEKLFDVKNKPNVVSGSGVELPADINNDRYREKFKITDDYIIYVGRIDLEKGCKEMFEAFLQYKKQYPDDRTKLVLMGKAMIDIPKHNDIVYQGFVSEADKFDGISGAKALWLPSKYESLSIAVLEAMSLGVPVMVNGECEVLKGHCIRSGAGVYYTSTKEAPEKLKQLMTSDEEMADKARQYIQENYQWENIVAGICEVMETIGK